MTIAKRNIAEDDFRRDAGAIGTWSPREQSSLLQNMVGFIVGGTSGADLASICGWALAREQSSLL